jgi:hypothetical protein
MLGPAVDGYDIGGPLMLLALEEAPLAPESCPAGRRVRAGMGVSRTGTEAANSGEVGLTCGRGGG